MAAPRSSQRKSAPRSSASHPPSAPDDSAYSAKKKARPSPSRFLPRWFVALLFLALLAAAAVDRKKRLLWEGAIRDYLEPPPIGIKLTDRGRFARESAKDEGGGAGAAAAPSAPAGPASAALPPDDPTLLSDHLSTPLHVVFSTDCSPYQHWQSYLLFYSALRARQPGTVTRIASGCSEDDAARAREWFDVHVRPMSGRFRLHLTPRFSSVKVRGEGTGKDYKYFNKPYGLRHWMERSPLVGADADGGGGEAKSPGAVIVLLDPDMIILRPITSDFSVDRDVIIPKRVLKDRKMRVEEGVPFAQAYGVGAHWKEFDFDSIIGPGVSSPARELPRMEGLLRYAVGPPYLAAARDMYAIAVKWTEFVPGVYAQYPKLLAEMYGYCIAAAHLELPHQKVESLMVSEPTLNCEGWDFVETMPDGEVCSFATRLDHAEHPLPNVMHYC